jgi:hypothetical protein
VAGCCKHGNEPAGSMKGGKFLNDQLCVGVSFSRRTLPHGVC